MDPNARGKRIPSVIVLLLALAAATALFPASGSTQDAAKKLSKQDILGLLTGDVPSDEVAREAQKAGISFQVTAAVEKEIRDAGGTDELIRVLRTLAPSAPSPAHNTPPPSPPVLMIATNPGSQVYVDDELVGSASPQGRLKSSRLPAGDHHVRITLSGYQDYEEEVSLTEGQTITVTASLQRVEAPRPSGDDTGRKQTVNPGRAGYLGIIPMEQQPAGARGVVISGAQPGGPAEQAGLKTYDTILAVNQRLVTTPADLRAALADHQAGDVVTVTWYNGSTTVSRQIRLAAQSPTPGPIPPGPGPGPVPGPRLVTFLVAHDHGRSGQDYCVGVMGIGNGMVYYKSNNGIHNFEIPLNSIKEVRRNAVYLVGLGAFHIITRTGSHYNFVVLNQQGQYQPPDQILTAIDSAMHR
jgi:hypothetical protein